MKTPLLSFLILFSLTASSQIITPTINAYFGVDADLKARYVNGNLQASDDWYVYPGTIGTSSNGTNVIDTAGAAAIVAGYLTDVSPWPKRMASLYRGMSRPAFTVVNNRLWLDALFVRDYHGTDTTTFAWGSNKNAMNPSDWTGDVQGVPDKNDILDMYMHIRREGPTSAYPLWMFGGLSLDNVTGNRYFDFEMYQTDIYYDRVSKRWYGYGPQAGHTAWQFDAAGNVTKAGDIIFSAAYQSASLDSIEARIWVDRASLSITPSQFTWTGRFDGATNSSQYGYASIKPNTTGAFYVGLQCGNGEWAGPFSLILQDNSMATNYIGKQFMEFSVNLTKLGLDPVTSFGGDVCGSPFNRLVVKTRASESFTAELKDFIAPTDLFLAPRADALADVPIFCGTLNSVSNLAVVNPTATSIYTWTTTDGNIVGTNVGPTATADAPGTYVVTQQLLAGCSAYATDTVVVLYDEDCTTLEGSKIKLSASVKDEFPYLNWISYINNRVDYYEVERSVDGRNFSTIGIVKNTNTGTSIMAYTFTDSEAGTGNFYYRLKVVSKTDAIYTRIVNIGLSANSAFSILPNPAFNFVRLSLTAEQNELAKLLIYNIAGELVYSRNYDLVAGFNSITLQDINRWKAGVYMVRLSSATLNQWQKLIIGH